MPFGQRPAIAIFKPSEKQAHTQFEPGNIRYGADESPLRFEQGLKQSQGSIRPAQVLQNIKCKHTVKHTPGERKGLHGIEVSFYHGSANRPGFDCSRSVYLDPVDNTVLLPQLGAHVPACASDIQDNTAFGNKLVCLCRRAVRPGTERLSSGNIQIEHHRFLSHRASPHTFVNSLRISMQFIAAMSSSMPTSSVTEGANPTARILS